MNIYTAMHANACAARGAALLDEQCEGWALLIDTARLNLADISSCILGQTAHCVTKGDVESHLVTSYTRALHYLVTETTIPCMEFAIHYGFHIPAALWSDAPKSIRDNGSEWIWLDTENHARWEMLTIAWREQIRERLAQ